jgi:CDP-glucose 4,6-dehydratase
MRALDSISAYHGKKVLITGHTGFKGRWLTLWLTHLGAKVYGYALPAPTVPSMYNALKLGQLVDDCTADIRNFDFLKKTINRIKPDIIFHLAAQSLVRESYLSPLETVEVNSMGTINVLEAVRQLQLPMSLVMVTSDKCYENKEWLHAYRETDRLGGRDPYSASKAGAEIFIHSWRASFFDPALIPEHGVRVASVRAGNVVGGGDWTKDNIVPDCVRSLLQKKIIHVRNPRATRPWQHVLEALGGYLLVGARLLQATPASAAPLCGAFNFGPTTGSSKRVKDLVETVVRYWGDGAWDDVSSPNAPHEASMLHISIDKACHLLQWQPTLDFNTTISQTVDWYKNAPHTFLGMRAFTLQQILAYHDDSVKSAAVPSEVASTF